MADVVPAPLEKWWVKPGLAALIFAIFAGALGAMVKIGNETQITSMVQAIIVLASGAAGYFFGSSSGSERKDSTIAANTAALASSTPAPAPATVAPSEPTEPSDAAKALDDKVAAHV